MRRFSTLKARVQEFHALAHHGDDPKSPGTRRGRLLPIGLPPPTLNLLEKCSEREVEEAKRTFYLLWGVTIYQTIVFSFCLHTMFATPGSFNPGLLGAALAFACIIQLVEVALVLIPATQVSGQRAPSKWRLKIAAVTLSFVQAASIALAWALSRLGLLRRRVST